MVWFDDWSIKILIVIAIRGGLNYNKLTRFYLSSGPKRFRAKALVSFAGDITRLETENEN